MELGKPFSIDPATNSMDVLGSAGYSFDLAIADLIDNSITAKAKNITIYVDYISQKPFIYIQDDGYGMDYPTLQKAAVVGAKSIEEMRSMDDLGRYSTGMKSATKSFCNNIIISSKTKNTEPTSIDIDYDHIKEVGIWEAFPAFKAEMEEKIGDQGTIVYCDRLKLFQDNYTEQAVFQQLDGLETSLSHIFGKFIIEDGLSIFIRTPNNLTNPIRVKGWDPFSLPESKAVRLIYDQPIEFKKGKIGIKAYIMPVANNLSQTDQNYMRGKGLVNQEGFYVYRERRLITEGSWLDIPETNLEDKCKYARIEVLIPNIFDKEFDLNFTKSHITLPPELISAFSKIAKKARTESRKSFNYMKQPSLKPRLKEKEEKVWRITNNQSGAYLSINKNHPLIQNLCSSMSKKQLSKLLSLLEKTIPVKMIQSQETSVGEYAKDEIKDYIQTIYAQLLKEGKTLPEIKSYMKDIEPFRSHLDELSDFFGNLEESNKK
jgi:hypothetical protein